VVTITITPAAFAAIASTLPKGSTVVGRPYGRGYAVTLDQQGFDRLTAERRSMIGLRFKSDRSVPDARFETYRREFGDKFEAIELEDADAAPADRPPHSVLTIHMREDGPTKTAEQRVIAFFKERTGA
jgi:hypothetical protein